MPAPIQNVPMLTVNCLGAISNPKVVHPAHVYSVDMQQALNNETRLQVYYWCPGWAG